MSNNSNTNENENSPNSSSSSTTSINGSGLNSNSSCNSSKKDEFEILNAKFKTCLQNIHQLKQEKIRLEGALLTFNTFLRDEKAQLKKEYESQLKELRNAKNMGLDKITQLEIERERYREKYESECDKCAEVLLKLDDSLNRIEELKSNLDFEVTEKIRLENKLHDLRDEFEKQLIIKDLEIEQLTGSRCFEIDIPDVDDNVIGDFQSILDSIKEETEKKLQHHKIILDTTFKSKVDTLEASRQKQDVELSALNAQITRLREQLADETKQKQSLIEQLNAERQRFTDEFRELSRSQNYYRRELDVFKCLFETAERKLNTCALMATSSNTDGDTHQSRVKFELSIEYKYESNLLKTIVLKNFSNEDIVISKDWQLIHTSGSEVIYVFKKSVKLLPGAHLNIHNGQMNTHDLQHDFYLDSNLKWPYNGQHTTTILKDSSGLEKIVQRIKRNH